MKGLQSTDRAMWSEETRKTSVHAWRVVACLSSLPNELLYFGACKSSIAHDCGSLLTDAITIPPRLSGSSYISQKLRVSNAPTAYLTWYISGYSDGLDIAYEDADAYVSACRNMAVSGERGRGRGRKTWKECVADDRGS
jgi:hypothetical protein